MRIHTLVAAVLISLLTSFSGAAHAAQQGKVAGLVKATGKVIGLSAGVAVTTALALSKKWNKPLLGQDGKPEKLQIGKYAFTLRARHAPVLGPKILDFASRMKTGTKLQRLEHSLVLGLGEGAKIAPPLEGKIEANFAAALHR